MVRLWCQNQGAAYRGRKLRIFFEMAIIDLKYHFRLFLTEDFYIFSFFAIYRQENISFNFFAIFRQEQINFNFWSLQLQLVTCDCECWVCVSVWLCHTLYCFISRLLEQSPQAPLQPITMDHHPVTVPNDDDVVTVGAVFDNPLFVFFCASGEDLKYFFLFFCHCSRKFFLWHCVWEPPFCIFFVCLRKV